MSLTPQREELHLRTLASGARLMVPVFRFSGGAGKRVYIQANIHGPEIAGIGAAHVLIDRLQREPAMHGSITIVPSINPVGLDSKINGMQVGYADLNETVVGNFNRVYQLLTTERNSDDPDAPRRVALDAFAAAHLDSSVPTIVAAFEAELQRALDDVRAKRSANGAPRFGLKLAFTVQQLAMGANYVIDLHTAGKAAYHIFTFAEMLASVPHFDLHNVIQLEDDFSGVFDEAFLLPWLRLRHAFLKLGRDVPFAAFDREAFTLELANADAIARDTMERDAERILNYLRAKGVLEGAPAAPAGVYHCCGQQHYYRYNAPTGGLILWHKGINDRVQAGEVLCTILCAYNAGTGAPTEVPVRAQHDGILNNLVESHVVHEGMALCSLMTQVRDVPAEQMGA